MNGQICMIGCNIEGLLVQGRYTNIEYVAECTALHYTALYCTVPHYNLLYEVGRDTEAKLFFSIDTKRLLFIVVAGQNP